MDLWGLRGALSDTIVWMEADDALRIHHVVNYLPGPLELCLLSSFRDRSLVLGALFPLSLKRSLIGIDLHQTLLRWELLAAELINVVVNHIAF